MRRRTHLALAFTIIAAAAACSAPNRSPTPVLTDVPGGSVRPSPSTSPAAGTHGEVAYVAGEDPQIHLLDLASGESRQLTRLTIEDAELTSAGPYRAVLSCGFGPTGLTWSRDGALLAFAYGGCEGVVYVTDVDGNLRRIGDGHGPTWSPDSRRLLFSPNRPFCPGPPCGGQQPHPGAWNLQVADVEAGTEPAAFTLDPSTLSGGQPIYSPDGSLIAYSGPMPDPAAHPELFAASYVMNEDGTAPKLIARGAWPAAWLPDGRLIVVDEGTGSLRAVDLATTEVEPLGASAGPAAVAPDGSRLLVTLNNLAGVGIVRLTGMDGEVFGERAGYAGAWAPDSRAAILIDAEGVGGFVLVDRDGAELGDYVVPDAFNLFSVAWRPGS